MRIAFTRSRSPADRLGEAARKGRRRAEAAAKVAQDRAQFAAEEAAPYVERGREVASELAREAKPLVDRALRRQRPKRRRATGILALVVLLFAIAGVVAFLLWRSRRDEEYARLQPEPDVPDTTPTGSTDPAREPSGTSPGSGPSGGSAPWTPEGGEPVTPGAPREPVRAQQPRSSPTAHLGGASLPHSLASTRPPFAAPGSDLPPPTSGRPSLP
jgi:hypothetical protein